MDRRDLLDYINGVSATSAHIAKPQKAAAPGTKSTSTHAATAAGKSATTSNDLGQIFGFDLAAKRAALPASVRDDFQVLKKLKTSLRTINTTSNILSVQNTTKVRRRGRRNHMLQLLTLFSCRTLQISRRQPLQPF